tara:strand:- start:6503 stop:6703 length:201 start_codon:yes stop_codon:yes gene_type:complete
MAQSFTVSITDDLWTKVQANLQAIATDKDEEELTVTRMNTYLSMVVTSRLESSIQKKKLNDLKATF